MKSIFKKILIFTSLLGSLNLFATEFNYLARSPRGLLLGDAFTAIADDEYTLFYNPAAMGRHTGVSLYPLNPVLGVTNVLEEMDRFENFPSNDEAAIADRILGLPIYTRAGIYPGLKMAKFGFTLFADNKMSLLLTNAVHPQLSINYRYDRGFAMGGAFNIGSGASFKAGKKNEKGTITAGRRLSIGGSVKHVRREALDGTFSLMGTTLLSRISQGVNSATELKEAFGFNEGKGWGVDLGVEYSQGSGNSLFTAGLVANDIGDIHFRKLSGEGKVPKQYMNVAAGVSFKQDFKIFDYTLSSDLHPLNEEMDFMQRVHLGAELGIPFITLHTGWNAGYLSYGATVKLWPIKLTAGFYGIEVGSKYKEEEAKRIILYLSLFDFSINL